MIRGGEAFLWFDSLLFKKNPIKKFKNIFGILNFFVMII